MLVRPVIFRAPDDGGGTGTTTDAGTTDGAVDTTDDANDDLADAGKKALDAFKSRARVAEREAKAAKAELDALRAQSMTEQERAVAAARAEGEQAAMTKANQRLLAAEVRIAAAGKLADPSDAERYIDFADMLDAAGEVDSRKVERAVNALVKEKPYLAAGPQPGGSFDQGARNTANGAPDMNALIRQAAGRA